MARLIDADELLRRYDEEHEGPPGKARKLIEEAPTVGGWVRVKDRLPKKKGDYLIYNTDGTVWPYWYDADDNSWYDSCGYKTDIVTHWMPLPSAEGLNEA